MYHFKNQLEDVHAAIGRLESIVNRLVCPAEKLIHVVKIILFKLQEEVLLRLIEGETGIFEEIFLKGPFLNAGSQLERKLLARALLETIEDYC